MRRSTAQYSTCHSTEQQMQVALDIGPADDMLGAEFALLS